MNGGGEEGGEISHLLFADDALFFCETSDDHLRHLRVVLLCFEEVSGLKVNIEKSEIIPVGHTVNIEALASCHEFKLQG